MLEQILFYIFAGLLIASALMVISVRNPVYAALFLVLAFFFSAGIWLLLQAEFLAIVLILVYVGAVMVLFLFVVMMLDINLSELRAGFAKYLPFGVLVALLMVYAMVEVFHQGFFVNADIAVEAKDADYSNTEALGRELYTRYLYPFEIAGAILLVAIIAAISLTFRGRKTSKQQQPEQQVTTRRNDRVRLVNRPSGQQKSS